MERLRHIREQAGYSQQDLADESGVSQHTISEIELDRRKPQGRTLRKLAGVLGVEVRDFFEVEDARPLGQAPPSEAEGREPEVHTGKAHLTARPPEKGRLLAGPGLVIIGREGLARLLGRTERGEISAEEAMSEVEKDEIRQ